MGRAVAINLCVRYDPLLDNATKEGRLPMSLTRTITAAMLIASPAVAQTPNDPFPAPIAQVEGVIRVNYTEFASIPDVGGSAARMMILVDNLEGLDLPTRTIILKMQPRIREELLQGMREEGPEGYRAFIRDYFRRLTKVQSPK